MLVGPADWTSGSGDRAPLFAKTPAPGERNPPYGSLTHPDFVGYGLSAWASFTVTGDGPIAVQANAITDTAGVPKQGEIPRSQAAYRFFNTGSQCNTGGTVASLKLHPAKAYRHIHDSITLTATALDANGTQVQGATVVFAVHGDCHPRTTQPPRVVTDAAGRATFRVAADKPGAVTVVAATLGANGVPVVSESSVVFFFADHHSRDERERRFYER